MHPAHPARFIAVRKAPFHLLASLPQQPLPTFAPNPPPVGVYRRLFFLLPLPAPPSAVRLRAVAAYLPVRQLGQHFVAVIPLIQHHFFRPLRIHGLFFLPLRHRRDLFSGFAHRLAPRCRVARVGRLQRDPHHRSAAEIHRVFHLVRQVRPPILHLGDAGIRIVRMLRLLIRSLVRSLPIQPRQLLARRGLDPRLLRQPLQKLLVAFSRVPPHDRPQRGVRFQRGGVM